MLIYVESTAFPHRTFVCRVFPNNSIARLRAQILHILYELGREDHQFRLRYKGQYLRDAYTVEDYGIIDNAIVKMLPLSKKTDSVADLRSLSSHSVVDYGVGQTQDVKNALAKEVKIFDRRERYILDFKSLLYLHFMASCFSFLTTYWYSGIWTAAVFLYGTLYCPTFTRMGGFIGKNSIHKYRFCVIYGILSFANGAASVALASLEWIKITNHGCPDLIFTGDCSHQIVFSAVLYSVQSVCLLASFILAWLMLANFRFEYGDHVEKFLVQSRDIDQVLEVARNGKLKEKRIAAFELASLAAAGDDNKFRIVAEGGLEVLISMSLCRDEATQAHAVEAIAEMLTVPIIQDRFVEMDGVRTLTALLNSPDPRLMEEAALALSYIVSDSEEHKHALVLDHGLSDLAHAAHHGTLYCQRIVAGVLLELAFNSDIRLQMASMNTPAKALIQLCHSNDHETQQFAFQTLELLAIESADMICSQPELLETLVALPRRTLDEKLYIMAGKLMIYYAEDRQSCEELMKQPNVKNALGLYARTTDPILQKIVAKVIYCMLEYPELKIQAREMGLEQILKYIRSHAADRDAWDMADQGIQALLSDDNLSSLPQLSTMEKLSRMDTQARADLVRKEFGSRASLGSRLSLRSERASIGGSSGDLKKGIE